MMHNKNIKNEFGEYVSLLHQFDNLTRAENLGSSQKFHVIRNDRQSYNYKKVGDENFNPFYEPIYYMIDDKYSSETDYSL